MPEDVRAAHIRLQASIAKLTRPYRVETKQRPEGGGYKITPIMHDPLLTQLQTMTGSSLGGKSTFNFGTLVIDTDAVEKIAAVSKHLMASWVSLIPGSTKLIADSHLTLEHSLNLWGSMFEEHRQLSLVTEPRVEAEAKIWGGWVKLIEAKFAHERTSEYMSECPKCGSRYVLDKDLDRVAAITITWREPLKDSSAACRFCGTDWVGEHRLRQLAGGPKHVDTAPLELAM